MQSLSKDSMAQLDFDNFTAVRVGPEIVGWVGPTLANTRLHADVIIVMGDKTFCLDIHQFQWGYAELQHSDLDEVMHVIEMLRFAKHFAVPVPAGSMDISPEGILAYSPKSIRTIMAALHNFFNALAAEVQAGFHLLSPVEVVRKFAELASCDYPIMFAEKFTWRGMLLNDVVQETTMKAKVAYTTSEAPYTGCWKIQELPRTFASLGSSPFGAFVGWQTRSKYNPATRITPENVVHIRANSWEEYELGNHEFNNLHSLRWFMSERMPGVQDASFFFSIVGDPLEEWIDGETISVEDFRAAVSF